MFPPLIRFFLVVSGRFSFRFGIGTASRPTRTNLNVIGTAV
jgi:hypothetical protein